MRIKAIQLDDVQKALVTSALKIYLEEEEGKETTNDRRDTIIATGKALVMAIEHGEVIIATYQYR